MLFRSREPAGRPEGAGRRLALAAVHVCRHAQRAHEAGPQGGGVRHLLRGSGQPRPEGDRYLIQTAVPNGKVYFPAVRLEGADDSKATSGLKDYPPQFGIDPRPGADPEARAAMMFPLPELALTGRVGVVNFLQDADKVGRRYYQIGRASCRERV